MAGLPGEGAPLTPDRMSSMLAAIVRGVSLGAAAKAGLVRTQRDRDVWMVLSREVAEIEADGFVVEIPVEPLA